MFPQKRCEDGQNASFRNPGSARGAGRRAYDQQEAPYVYEMPLNATVDALQERESLGPTGVGHGVALPHARMDGLQSVVGSFIRLDKGMEFDAVDRQKVDLIFCLFAPVDSGVAHLKALALVSRTLRDEAICRKLRSNDDPATIHAILTEATRNQAA